MKPIQHSKPFIGKKEIDAAALGVGTGDEVIIPAYSCVALLNAVLAVGAQPVLADVEPDRWTLDIADAKQHLNKRVKAIIAVHLFGFGCDVPGLLEFDVPI